LENVKSRRESAGANGPVRWGYGQLRA